MLPICRMFVLCINCQLNILLKFIHNLMSVFASLKSEFAYKCKNALYCFSIGWIGSELSSVYASFIIGAFTS